MTKTISTMFFALFTLLLTPYVKFRMVLANGMIPQDHYGSHVVRGLLGTELGYIHRTNPLAWREGEGGSW